MAGLRIYTDENVDVRISEGLRRRGINAFSAVEKEKIGIADTDHFTYASENQAVIFTHDHQFLEIAKTLKEEDKEHWGV